MLSGINLLKKCADDSVELAAQRCFGIPFIATGLRLGWGLTSEHRLVFVDIFLPNESRATRHPGASREP